MPAKGDPTRELMRQLTAQITALSARVRQLEARENTQYGMLAGRAGGQTIIGGTGSGDDLTLKSTGHATKGEILIAPDQEDVGIGVSGRAVPLAVRRNIDGDANFIFENIAGGAASTNERVFLSFSLGDGGSPRAGGRFEIGKEADYQLAADRDAYFAFLVAQDASNVERLRIHSNGSVRVGPTGNTPAGTFAIFTAATNDDINYDVRQARVATTDATPTTLQTIAIAASRTYLIDCHVIARRTGGTAGTADDGAAYHLKSAYTTKTGTVTLLGALEALAAEDVAGYAAALVISGTNVLVQVTGVTDTVIVWHCTTKVSYVGT